MPRLREAAKLVWRAAARRRATVKWLAYLNHSDWLRELVRREPRLIKKMFRPYLSLRLSHRSRVAVLMSHYDEIARLGWQDLVLRAAARDVALATIAGKSGQLYQLTLTAVRDMEREGELVFHLRRDGRRVYALACAWWRAGDGTLALAVGCLQGGTGDDARDLIRQATRDLYGLRPRSLMLKLAQHIGGQGGAAHLLLTASRHHVLWRQAARGQVHADYDAMWDEHGAAPAVHGDFELPCVPLAPPDLAALPSSKRSEARKRFALLDALCRATWTALTAPDQPSVAPPSPLPSAAAPMAARAALRA